MFWGLIKLINKFRKLLLINLQMGTMRNKLSMVLVCLVMVGLIGDCQGELQFERRNSFSLGENVTVVKFSPDYTLLAVLRSNVNKLFSYNPMTFELIGDADLEPGTMPVDLEIFGNDIIVATRSNMLLVYERKVGSAELTLKQKVTLKTYGGVTGMKLEKLTEDFNDKSQANSTRHLVVWSLFS